MKYSVIEQGDVQVLRVLRRSVASASYFAVETNKKQPAVVHQGAGMFLLMPEHSGTPTFLQLPIEANCRVVAQATRYGFEALAATDTEPEAAMDIVEEGRSSCPEKS